MSHISANTTVLNTDKGSTLALGGNAFFTVTFGNANTYDADFSITIVNENDWVGGRAPYLSIPGNPRPQLVWPTQTVKVFAKNSKWHVDAENRVKIPGGNVLINTDFVHGSDTVGVSDGLGTGTGAFKSVSNAMSIVYDNFDFTGLQFSNSLVTIKMAAGTNDNVQVHVADHSYVGAHGSSAIVIDGNGSTLSANTGPVQTFFGSILKLKNVTLTSSGNHCISIYEKSTVYILENVVFGSTPYSQIDIQNGGLLYLFNNYSISGSGEHHMRNVGAGTNIRLTSPITVTFLNNVTYTDFIFAQAPGYSDLGAITWNLNGHTVTTTNCKYNISGNHVLTGTVNIPGSSQPSVCVSTGAQTL